MCGRYYIDENTIKDIERIVHKIDEKLRKIKTGDIYPSNASPVLYAKDNEMTAAFMSWGFPKYDGNGLLINARSETVTERRTFKDSVLRRRCILPARHFYEWSADKNKAAFSRENTSSLFMAGIYKPVGDREQFMILTAPANASVSPVHDRMPVLLEENELTDWLLNDGSLNFYLHKTPPLLVCRQEYQQQTLVFEGVDKAHTL